MHRIEIFVRALAHALGILMVLVVGLANMTVVALLFNWPAGLAVGAFTILTAFAVHIWYSVRVR